MMVPVGRVSTRSRLRAVDEAQVKALAESIAEVGLLNPITVYRCEVVFNGQTVDGFGLVAGAHRLEAVKSLGWPQIPAVVVDLTEDDRIIAECDENLCGTKLSEAERAAFTIARKKAYERKHPETRMGAHNQHTSARRQVGDEQKSSNFKRFTAETAERTGRSERSVQRDSRRGEKIKPEVLDVVKDGPLKNNGAFLDRLAKVDPEQQEEFVSNEMEARAAALTETKPRRKPNPPRRSDKLRAMIFAWEAASEKDQDRFLSHIGAVRRPADG